MTSELQTTGAHIDQSAAAGLAALGEMNAERMHAEAHARTCARCEAMLTEARALLQLLDAAAPLSAPNADALERCRMTIQREIARDAAVAADARTTGIPATGTAATYTDSPTRLHWPKLMAPAAVAGLLAALLVLLGKQREAAPHAWVEAAAALGLAMACVAMAPRLPSAATALSVAVGGSLVLVAASTSTLSGVLGAKCALIELVTAALPFAAFAYVAIRNRAQVPASSAAAIAAAGALAGQAALHLTCPERSGAPHLLVFHLGAVALAAALGAIASVPLTRRIARLV